MNWAQIFTKRFMCFVNGVFMVLGIAVIIIGALVLTRYGDYKNIAQDGFFTIPSLLLTLGCFVTILFFLGFYGLKTEKYWMIKTFSVILAIIFAMELIGGICAYLLKNQTDEVFKNSLSQALSEYPKDRDTALLWDKVQFKLDCCGVNNYTDYKALNISVPTSCCKHLNGSVAMCNTTLVNDINAEGCANQMHTLLMDSISTIGAVAIVIAVLHLLWIIGSCYFAKVISRESYESV